MQHDSDIHHSVLKINQHLRKNLCARTSRQECEWAEYGPWVVEFSMHKRASLFTLVRYMGMQKYVLGCIGVHLDLFCDYLCSFGKAEVNHCHYPGEK